MDIFDSNGTKLEYSAVLANLPITESCEHVEELMKADHIVLSWRDSEKYTLPVGAYITYKGVNYALLEPYESEQKNEGEFEYTPNFQHPKMYLGKVPFCFPTTDTEGDSITLLEWPYSGDLDTLLTFFCRTMESALGLEANTFNYSILGEIDAVVSTTFNAEDILSALTNIANKLKCEWHIDWDYKILYFGHIELSRDEVDETVLEVGVNVGTPSVRSSKEGFYNTYEPQGSTRNISKRAASGEYVQGDVRLALNEEDYPDKVIYTNESGTVIASLPQGVKKYVKPLIFDNIYPKLDLYVYDVRCRERDLLDDNGEKIIDHYDGSTPVYKRYAVWYMRLAYATKIAGHVTQWHDYTINPETDIISGKNLGGAFQPNTYEGAESFPLAGRGQADDGGYGFELIYHSTGETIPASGDDTGVVIKAGDYEIVFQQQNDYILPTTATQGIIPKGVKVGGQEVTDLNSLTNLDDGQKGNIVDLYNIVIDNRYNESAQNDLAQETLKYIANQFKDNNSYTLKSDVVAFKKRIDQDELLHTDSSLYIGEKVIYKNGDYELETRVMKLVTKLDYAFVQEITVGNEVLKGSTTTLKEQVQTILSGGVGNGSGGGGVDAGAVRKIVQAYANPRFLSKLNDDTAQGFITMLKGLQIGANFVSDILGEGGVLRMRDDGKVELVTDILYARVKAYFDSVEIREYKHTGGNRIASVAGNKICRVAWYNSSNVELEQTQANLSSVAYFRCYFRASDGEDTVRNNWVVGDLAYCHITSIVNSSDNPEQKGLNQKHLWRLVIGRNTEGTLTEDDEAYIDLSNRATETISGTSYTGYQSGSDAPEAQDDIIQLGNVNDTTRQGAIVEFVTGTDAPSYQIYQGINSFSLNNKNQIGFGYNTSTGRAYLNVYGDAYIGARDRSTFIEYKQSGTGGNPELNIKANVTFTNVSEMSQFVKDNQNNYDDSEIKADIAILDATTQDLQKQIDGAIETWFMTGVPTLENAPANEWTTDDEKDKHIGDLYYDKATTYAYRFLYDDETDTYGWQHITDDALAEALRIASEAQETADGKRTIYSVWGAWVKNNVNTLEVGDLFIPAANTTQGGVTYKANKVYKCTTDGQAQFQAADYIDDAQAQAKIDTFVSNTYNPDKINLQSQIDGKAETFRQATDPSSSWTDADKPTHVGDLWMDISADGGNKTYIYQNTAAEDETPVYDWVAQEVPKEVFDEIDGKSTIFGNAIATPPTNYKKDDMWLLPAAATINGVSYKAGDVLSASQDSATYSATHWSKKVRYTDDTKADSILNNEYYQQLAGGTINGLIGTAKSIAEAAAGVAAAAKTSADAANTKLTAWADDGKISPTEKLALKNQKADVQKEYAQIIADAAKYSDVSTTAFTTAYNKAITAFNYYTSTDTENIDIITDEEEDSDATPRYSRIAAYYAARQTILEAMTTAAKNYATTQGNKFLNDAVYKAISAALGSKTDIVGGLVLTSLIGMRQQNEGGTYTVWGGISGEYDDWSGETHAKGHGIAAWYGGELLDKETLTTEQIAQGWDTLRWAKGVDRFDGSGYRADGNITWDEQGRVSIKDVTSIISNNNTDVLNELITFNNAFHFNLSQGTSTVLSIEPQAAFTNLYIRNTTNPNAPYHVATENWVDDHYVSKTFFRQLFRAFKPNATAGQADIEVEPNTIDATISNIKAMVGFWTEQYVSALGNNSDGGGGGAGVLYGLNDVTPNATGDGVMGAQDGYVLTYNGSTNHWYAAATAETYVLPQATANALGGIKIGYAASGKNYAIVLDANGKAYVNVPWTDTTYTLAGLMGSSAIGGATQPIYWDGSAFKKTTYTLAKSVPADAKFTDTTYSFSNADATLAWSTRTKIATTGGTDIYVTLPANPNTNTWRNIYLDGTEKLTTGINTKGLNFVGDGKTTISFLAAGTEEGQSGNANYATLKISSTWRGIQDNLTSDSTTDSLSAKQGKNLKTSITTLESYFTNGVAKKAEQLNTSRTLWGQSFNGTANVSGNMTGVGNITMSANDGTYIKIGDIYIGYDSTNSAIEIYKLGDNNAHVAANLYAHGAISALGQGVDGGGGGQGDVTWDLLAHTATNNRFIDGSYISGALAGYSPTSHTHTTTIATDSGTNQLTLAYGTKYKITAGGTSFIFTMPSADDTNTWRNIYVAGTEKLTTAISSKGLNFVAGSNVSLSFAAAGTGSGQSGNANYGTLTISATDTTYSVATHSANGLMSAADKTKLDGLEYFNAASRSSDGVVTLTTNKSNTTILDLTHQHSFLELVDRPTTLDGYGITGGNLTGNLSVAGAFSAASGKINGNTILDSNNSSVSKSGETLTVKINGTSQSLTNTNTTYSANNGVGLSGTTFYNSGVRATTINGNYLRVNTNGTNADLTIPYATSAGNADTVDNLHASNLVRFFLSPMSSGAPADSAKSWFTGTMPSSSGAIVYNVPGSEKTIIAGKSSGAYGHMLQLTYDDKYLRILRYKAGNWQSTDWEKIYAGYADSAGSVDWANVSSHPTKLSQFTNDSGFVTSSGVTSVATGTGLTGGTITSSGTISINSTYQTYISHGESAYNSLSNYLPLSGGTLTGNVTINGTANAETKLSLSGSQYTMDFLIGSGNVNRGIYDSTSNKWALYFDASNTIMNYGNVGIGTTSPSYKLHVSGTAYAEGGYFYTSTGAAVRVGKTTTDCFSVMWGSDNTHGIYNNTSGFWLISTNASGNTWLDCGTTNVRNLASSGDITTSQYLRVNAWTGYGSGSVQMWYNGSTKVLLINQSISSDGGVACLSDARHKQIVRNTDLTVEQIANMPSVIFKWTDGMHDNDLHVGSLAQNWQQVLPEVVLKQDDAEGTLSLQYGVAALVAAITTARKVVDHEREIAQLKNRVKALEDENKMLKTKL